MGIKVREKIKGSGVWWVFVAHNNRRKSKKIGAKDAAIKFAAKINEALALQWADDVASELTAERETKMSKVKRPVGGRKKSQQTIDVINAIGAIGMDPFTVVSLLNHIGDKGYTKKSVSAALCTMATHGYVKKFDMVPGARGSWVNRYLLAVDSISPETVCLSWGKALRAERAKAPIPAGGAQAVEGTVSPLAIGEGVVTLVNELRGRIAGLTNERDALQARVEDETVAKNLKADNDELLRLIAIARIENEKLAVAAEKNIRIEQALSASQVKVKALEKENSGLKKQFNNALDHRDALREKLQELDQENTCLRDDARVRSGGIGAGIPLADLQGAQ